MDYKKIKEEISKREKLHMKSKKTPTKVNIHMYEEYKNKNLINQQIAERDYFGKQFVNVNIKPTIFPTV